MKTHKKTKNRSTFSLFLQPLTRLLLIIHVGCLAFQKTSVIMYYQVGWVTPLSSVSAMTGRAVIMQLSGFSLSSSHVVLHAVHVDGCHSAPFSFISCETGPVWKAFLQSLKQIVVEFHSSAGLHCLKQPQMDYFQCHLEAHPSNALDCLCMNLFIYFNHLNYFQG